MASNVNPSLVSELRGSQAGDKASRHPSFRFCFQFPSSSHPLPLALSLSSKLILTLHSCYFNSARAEDRYQIVFVEKDILSYGNLHTDPSDYRLVFTCMWGYPASRRLGNPTYQRPCLWSTVQKNTVFTVFHPCGRCQVLCTPNTSKESDLVSS